MTTPPHIPVTAIQCSNCHTNTAASFTTYTMSHTAVTSSRCDSCHNGSYTSQGTKGAQGKSGDHPKTTADCGCCHTSTTSFDQRRSSPAGCSTTATAAAAATPAAAAPVTATKSAAVTTTAAPTAAPAAAYQPRLPIRCCGDHSGPDGNACAAAPAATAKSAAAAATAAPTVTPPPQHQPRLPNPLPYRLPRQRSGACRSGAGDNHHRESPTSRSGPPQRCRSPRHRIPQR